RLGFGKYFRLVRGFGTGALQDINVVSGEIAHLKTQCLAFVGQAITEVGASPIHHGHKVVTDIKNTGGGDIADRLLVVGNILAVIASTRLDVVMQWNAFNYGPL